eukprot:1981939-Prymnesium_polylepis.1
MKVEAEAGAEVKVEAEVEELTVADSPLATTATENESGVIETVVISGTGVDSVTGDFADGHIEVLPVHESKVDDDD